MKMAFALFEYFPYGGLQRDMLAIAELAQQRGHQVTVFTRAWHGEPPPVGISVTLVPVAARANHARDEAFAEAVAQQWQSFDLRVGFNKMPGLDWYYAADGCQAARYGRLHQLLPRYRSRLKMERAVFAAEASTGILSISPPQMALYREHYGTAAERFVSLPPGIRRDRRMPADYAARRDAMRQRLKLPAGQPMLLFVGSGFRTKGLDRVIELLPHVPGAVLYIVGDDNAAPYLRQARRLNVGKRVHFMGGQDNIPEWLWAADLLLHPAYAENTGTVLLEAAIAGLPVLTTAACGYAPYITASHMGHVVTGADVPAALAAAATRLLAQPRKHWWPLAQAFADKADIYSLTGHVVAALEGERR